MAAETPTSSEPASPGPGDRDACEARSRWVEAGRVECALEDRGDGVDLGAPGELGDDAAEPLVQGDRRDDDVGEDHEVVVDDGCAVSSQLVSIPSMMRHGARLIGAAPRPRWPQAGRRTTPMGVTHPHDDGVVARALVVAAADADRREAEALVEALGRRFRDATSR